VDEYGYPVYESDVIVEPQLLLARSTTPSTDDAYPSGHMNALMLAGLAYAYAVPERFQELFTRAMEGGKLPHRRRHALLGGRRRQRASWPSRWPQLS
jgi:membrane-associated phospholipid phosphatase